VSLAIGAAADSMRRTITAHWLGRVPYGPTHALQQSLVDARVRGDIGDTLLLLEHEPVITLGRGADGAHVLANEERRRALGVDFHETGRGGDVTYHGPGQLVAYLIVDLKPERCDVRKYVRDLASVMIALAKDFGIDAAVIPNDPKLIGVWVDLDSPHAWPGDPRERASGEHASVAKIGAIGVRLSRWVTMHGFAFNVTTALDAYRMIVPCGITEHGVTSLLTLGALGALGSLGALGETPSSVEAIAPRVLPHFARVFDADVTMADGPPRIGVATSPAPPEPA
jgi:lipoyl(octanoyl) transferase